jgi:hypothetical protein
MQFGKLRWKPNAKFFFGCYCNADCQRMTESSLGATKQIQCAHSVKRYRKEHSTWSPNVIIRRQSGNRWQGKATFSYHTFRMSTECYLGGNCWRQQPWIKHRQESNTCNLSHTQPGTSRKRDVTAISTTSACNLQIYVLSSART